MERLAPPLDPWGSATTHVPEASFQDGATPVPSAEEWVYVEPDAFSNPYTEQPVYSSGPIDAPIAAPPQTPPPPPPPISGPQPPAASPDGVADPLLSSAYQPEKGELKIKERRTWKTWQMLTFAVLAAVLGMWINGNTGSASGTSATSSYKLPPAKGSSPTTTAGAASAGSGTATTTTAAGATTTTAAGSSTSTTSAAGAAGATATTAPVAVGPATVLVPETQQTGNWTSPAFTIAGGTWNVGWAFQCAPAPTGGPSFQIFAVSNGAAASGTPAVTSTAASGQSVTPLTSAGSQQVIVQTTAACRWAVKVTGSSS